MNVYECWLVFEFDKIFIGDVVSVDLNRVLLILMKVSEVSIHFPHFFEPYNLLECTNTETIRRNKIIFTYRRNNYITFGILYEAP